MLLLLSLAVVDGIFHLLSSVLRIISAILFELFICYILLSTNFLNLQLNVNICLVLQENQDNFECKTFLTELPGLSAPLSTFSPQLF